MRLFEINTRVHCANFDQITDAELAELSPLGFNALWLMGVWRISDGARKISKITSEDFEGSPYAVPVYEINRALGGRSQFARLVKRARSVGFSVIVDFVSNHMALDSPWIIQRGDSFIRGDTTARKQSTSEFFLAKSDETIAFGRDPYFSPWNDTAQLDYSNSGLRTRMIEVLKRISKVADGVRCDMAMLVLRDCFRQLWYPLLPQTSFDQKMPGEFWDQAIGEIKKISPNFKFIAESYWDKERQLRALGFDLCYEKKLYDGLVGHDLGRVVESLQRDSDALRGSLYFIENHDEPRAASVFSKPDNLAALALILSIPGSVLIHEGQMEGKHERLPVQRIKPLTEEPPDFALKESYIQLLQITRDDVFEKGDFQLFDPGVYGAIGFIRKDHRRVVAYLGQISEAWHRFNSPQMNISQVAREVGAQDKLRLTNLLTSRSITVHDNNGAFNLEMSQLGVDDDAKFCLLEASPA
ncbi:MAG: alpha-amylase family glycosyl hydrolase [Acidobacteriota bacterium]